MRCKGSSGGLHESPICGPKTAGNGVELPSNSAESRRAGRVWNGSGAAQAPRLWRTRIGASRAAITGLWSLSLVSVWTVAENAADVMSVGMTHRHRRRFPAWVHQVIPPGN